MKGRDSMLNDDKLQREITRRKHHIYSVRAIAAIRTRAEWSGTHTDEEMLSGLQ